MDFSVATAPFATSDDHLLAVVLFGDSRGTDAAKQADGWAGGAIDGMLARGDFAGEQKEVAVLYPPAGPKRLALAGLGKREKADVEALRRAVGGLVKKARALRCGSLTVHVPREVSRALAAKLPAGVPAGVKLGRAVFDACYLAAYEFDRYQGKKREEQAKKPGAPELRSVAASVEAVPGGEVAEAARQAGALEKAVRTARDLASLPGNDGTPTALAERARAVAAEVGLDLKVLERQDMERLGMGSLLGVARGSEEPPKLIILEHKPAGAKNPGAPIALVGKGVTFDSGGISIKPADGMDEMRFDKSGAAAVIGAMEGVARLAVPLHVVGLCPATENLPSGRAMKPGDVLTAMDGQTIEIINTDAEGRLILADALAYAVATYKPQAIVDLATLTGACVVALGNLYAGLFASDDALAGELRCASAGTGERIWPFPVEDDDYDERIKSWLADVKNSGGRPGGALTAARFLKKFVKDTPWAHVDIAGTAWTTEELPYYQKGATGFGVRLLVDWLRARAGN